MGNSLACRQAYLILERPAPGLISEGHDQLFVGD